MTTLIDNTRKELPFHGELTIIARDRSGNEFVYATPNTIVYDARPLMARLLVGDDITKNKIARLGVGLDGTAPVRENRELGNELLKVPTVGYTFPEPGHVELTALLDYDSAANGQELREAGLFSSDGSAMFARQVFGTITKSSSLQLQFIWRIIFT